jgi:hypothetical protein
VTVFAKTFREGFLAHFIVRDQVMRRVIPDPADRIGRHKTVDVDSAGAFERDRLKFFVLEYDVLAIVAFIAFYLVFLIDRRRVSAST